MQQVPQFVDVEDKVAGPLTWKHLMWIFAGGGILGVLWTFLEAVAFYIAAVPIAIITIAFAFVKPQGTPLIYFAYYGFVYYFKPRTFVWQREIRKDKKTKKVEEVDVDVRKHVLSAEDIVTLTQSLDSHGKGENQELAKLYKSTQPREKKSRLLSREKNL